MIVNRNLIHTHILKQTLQQQIQRLKSVCSQSYLNSYQQQLILTQRDYQLLVYEQDQNKKQLHARRIRSEMEYQTMIENKLQGDKKLQSVYYSNRQLMSALQQKRRMVKQQQEKVNQMQKQLQSTLLELQDSQQQEKKFNNKRSQEVKSLLTLNNIADLCGGELKQLKQQISAITEQTNIQHLNVQSSKQTRSKLQKEIQKLKKQIMNSTSQMLQEKQTCSSQLTTLADEKIKYLKQQEEKKPSVQNLQTQLQCFQSKQINILKQISIVQNYARQIQQKIIKSISLSRQISSQVFETKVALTNTREKVSNSKNKVNRLKILKSQLWLILTKQGYN